MMDMSSSPPIDFLPAGFLDDLRALLRIPSVYDASTADAAAPYGRAVADALAFVGELARRDGFFVTEYEGHAVSISLPGTGDGRIDVVSHVDVVEPGSGWTGDPFGAELVGSLLYGRGTQDMKTAFLITYYALKAIKAGIGESRTPLRRELRLVVGGDEERTMEDIVHYVKVAGPPDSAFTPDSAFPFCLGEKGALMWRITGTMPSCIEELDGGVQCNVVSPTARAVVRSASSEDSSEEEYRAAFSSSEIFRDRRLTGTVRRIAPGLLEISVQGAAAHASRPEDGCNATTALCAAIAHVEGDELARLFSSVFSDQYGGGAGLSHDISPMGRLTLNLGILRYRQGTIYGEIDCRYPYGVSSSDLTAVLKAACPPLKISLDYDASPTLADSSSPFVKVLQEAYSGVSGDTVSRPFISGGVTYSKVVPRCVAFGPLMPGESSLAHQADEHVDLKKIPDLLRIYRQAMRRLASVDDSGLQFQKEGLQEGEGR